MEPIKLMIVDDHCMIREGLKQLLELDGDIKIIGEASEGKACLNSVDSIKPDIVLLDINMPEMNGLKVLEQLKINKCKSKVLMLTIHNEVEYLMRAIDLGADGYIMKDSESATLRKAIFTIYNGQKYIQNELAALLNEIKEKMDTLTDEQMLTRREIEILKLLTEGLFNKEIAYQLSISEKTVKNHVSNIFKKICVSDRTQAAV
jgi:DNA-binding NarL/FixJ family response regulator